MKKLLILALATVALSVGAFAQQADAGAALKELNDLRNKMFSENRVGLTQAKMNEINDAVKAKALELTKGVEVDKVEASQAYTWAQIFSQAGKHQETCDLVKKYLTTNPEPPMKYSAQSLMMSACNSLGEADMLQQTLLSVRVPGPTQSAGLASSTVYVYVDTIVEKLGVDAGLKTLDEVEKNLVFEAPADYAKRMFEADKKRTEAAGNNTETDEARTKRLEAAGANQQLSTKFLFVDKRAELLEHAGQKDKAVELLNTFIKEAPEGAPVLRTAKGSLARIAMLGAPAPALVKERSYGTFEGLASLKGKVVLLDFFAHWCGPCIASFPDMKQLYADNKDKGLEIVGFTTYYKYYKQERNLEPDVEYARMGDFIKEHELPWPVVYGERSNFDAYGVTGIPHVTVIDRQGNVRKIKVGYSKESFKEFKELVEKLLAEK